MKKTLYLNLAHSSNILKIIYIYIYVCVCIHRLTRPDCLSCLCVCYFHLSCCEDRVHRSFWKTHEHPRPHEGGSSRVAPPLIHRRDFGGALWGLLHPYFDPPQENPLIQPLASISVQPLSHSHGDSLHAVHRMNLPKILLGHTHPRILHLLPPTTRIGRPLGLERARVLVPPEEAAT